MAAPMGRVLSSFPQFQTCFLSFRRSFFVQKCISGFKVDSCTYKMKCGAVYVLNTRNYTSLLQTPIFKVRRLSDNDVYGSIRSNQHQCRNLSSASSLTDEEVRKEIDAITDKFMEAKEYLDDAKDSMDTVYFDDDMKDAEDGITDTLTMYGDLLGKLTGDQKANVTRTIGLKMEELKAQLEMIKESLRDHE